MFLHGKGRIRLMLNIQMIEDLYFEIACDQYMYSDDENSYYKLTVAMERMIHTAKLLNKFPVLSGKYNDDAVEFVMWINYTDLFIATLEMVAQHFSYSIKYDKNIFLKEHNLADKSDKDFFRFVRAIVLPHALSLDNPKQKEFTNGKKAYCPSVVWDNPGYVRIVYYNADIKDDLQWYILCVADFENFLDGVFTQISDLVNVVKQRKTKKKRNDKTKIINEKYDTGASLNEKCKCLINLTIKYGDLNDKAERSVIMHVLNRCDKILSMKFYGRNKKITDEFKKYLNYALDDYYTYLCNQSNDEPLLEMMLIPFHDYTSKTDFVGMGYVINKISAEMESFDEYVRRYYFSEYFEKLKPALSPKIYIAKNMSMERICFLAIIVFFFDRMKYKQTYKVAFEKYAN